MAGVKKYWQQKIDNVWVDVSLVYTPYYNADPFEKLMTSKLFPTEDLRELLDFDEDVVTCH
jgi:hypothetical protein